MTKCGVAEQNEGCTAAPSPPNPCPGHPGKGRCRSLCSKERECSPPPLGVLTKGNTQVQQEKPFLSFQRMVITGPLSPPEPRTGQLSQQAKAQGEEMTETPGNRGPALTQPAGTHTHWPTLPLHTRLRMWVHRVVPRAHRCFSAQAARLRWKYRRRPCVAAGVDGVSRILGPAGLRGQHSWAEHGEPLGLRGLLTRLHGKPRPRRLAR